MNLISPHPTKCCDPEIMLNFWPSKLAPDKWLHCRIKKKKKWGHKQKMNSHFQHSSPKNTTRRTYYLLLSCPFSPPLFTQFTSATTVSVYMKCLQGKWIWAIEVFSWSLRNKIEENNVLNHEVTSKIHAQFEAFDLHFLFSSCLPLPGLEPIWLFTEAEQKNIFIS